MRGAWRALFLTVTAVAVGMELWASFDGDRRTEPWTDLIVAYVPAEAAIAVFGALAIWLPTHFAVRYRRRQRERQP